MKGAMRRTTLAALCEKHNVPCPADTRGQRFHDFAAFAAVYIAACECLRDEDDLFRLVREVAEDGASYGALWIEAALSMTFYAPRFGGPEATLAVLLRAAAAAEDATGVGVGFIVSAERFLPVEEAEMLAEVVHCMVERGDSLVHGRPGIVGFGLHAQETGNPALPFKRAFEIACGDGRVASVPHAGELEEAPGAGARSVEVCVRELKANRIGHGILCVRDQELVQELSRKGVCLDICATSNFLLHGVEDLADHPLLELLRAGVPCSINSDDPLLFGCDLLSEYQTCRDTIGLTDADLAQCATFSFEHSQAPEDLKTKALTGISSWLASRLETQK